MPASTTSAARTRRSASTTYAHTFGTLAASAGHSLVSVAAWMGHADTKTTEIYAHYAPAANEAEGLNFLIAGTGTRAVGVV